MTAPMVIFYLVYGGCRVFGSSITAVTAAVPGSQAWQSYSSSIAGRPGGVSGYPRAWYRSVS